MPELPDVTVYVELLAARLMGQRVEGLRFASPFFLRSVDPPASELVGQTLVSVERLGKRIVLGTDGDLFAVIHLMVAGRLRWLAPKAKIPGKLGLAALDVATGTLVVTEASSKKRASLHLARGRAALEPFQRGGLEVLGASLEEFTEVVRRERHTLKRTLTDPRLFSGIGNAYSDEILHRARMSPVTLSDKLSDADIARLRDATLSVLNDWTARLRAEAAAQKNGWPEKVTAFRDGMAVHGRYRQPCPDCGKPVQRIRYAENETNYCPTCQTGGKLLADRGLSRLLHGDWPKTLEDLEERKATSRG